MSGTMSDGSPVSPQLDARMLSELREWRARADTSDGARWSMRLTIDELDMLLRVADERDALKRELVDMPDDVPAPMPAVAEITHATMCGVGSSGSCFVPWCKCDCHLRSHDVALIR